MQQELTTTDISLQGSQSDINSCDNCGQQMHGPYCARCGQATRHFIKFFPSVVREILEDTLDIDGRFGRTLVTVMFRPGRATKDFLSGKRVHYTPPFRLYLFTSLLAFLMLSLEFGDIGEQIDASIHEAQQESVSVFDEDGNPASPETAAEVADILNQVESIDNPEEIAEVINQLGSIENEEQESAPDSTDIVLRAPGVPEDVAEEAADRSEFTIRFSDEAWDPETNPVAVEWLPDFVNSFFNRMLGNIQENGPRIQENPSILIDQVIQLLPQTLFILLPIFALILKFFYAFSKRYYMEHLIYSVHVHTFTLMILIAVGFVNILERALPPGAELALDIIQICLASWILLYLFIAQKRVYRQGWFFTFIKYNLVYITYTALQIIAITLVIVIGAATL